MEEEPWGWEEYMVADASELRQRLGNGDDTVTQEGGMSREWETASSVVLRLARTPLRHSEPRALATRC